MSNQLSPQKFLYRLMEKSKDELTKEALEGKQREFIGILAYILAALAFGVAVYHLYVTYFGAPFALLFRNIHWMMAGTLIFLYYPASKRSPENRPTPLDIGLVILTNILGLYVWQNWEAIAARAGAYTNLDIFFGFLLTLVVLEAGRRTVGWPIVIVALVFLVYAYFGPYMPGLLAHRGYSFARIFPFLYLTDAGIFGIPLGVSSRFILLFVIFGAVLERAGAGIFFRDLSLALVGRFTGGPAKAAIIFSAFIGSLTGSSTANVVTTGTFTIPLMKKVGYKPAFAAGVEADASTGGQILPPVMGAAAFVMAEYVGVRYIDVIVAAAIPAFFYFATSYYMVHYRSLKEGLVGLPKEELPILKDVLKSGAYFFLPLVLLIVFLVLGFSPSRAVFYAIMATIALSWLKAETRLGPVELFWTLAEGVKKALEVIAACAVAGIIIGMVTMTGLGLKFSTIIEALSGGYLLAGLFFSLIASLILGMGVPTTAKYIILATLVAPALVTMGAPLLAAHLFILYFGTDADITPPVGLAAYAAAGIARANPLETGWEAFKMGITAYVVPFCFIYGPALLMQGTITEIILAFITGLIACAGLGVAMQGWFLRKTPYWQRLLMLIGSTMLMGTDYMWDMIGLALLVAVWFMQYRAEKVKAINTA
jgi:TRAP transporter 4TM/12TM fusion protein